MLFGTINQISKLGIIKFNHGHDYLKQVEISKNRENKLDLPLNSSFHCNYLRLKTFESISNLRQTTELMPCPCLNIVIIFITVLSNVTELYLKGYKVPACTVYLDMTNIVQQPPCELNISWIHYR